MRIEGNNANSYMDPSLPNPSSPPGPILDSMIKQCIGEINAVSSTEALGQINSMIGLIRACNQSSNTSSIEISISQLQGACLNNNTTDIQSALASLQQALNSTTLTISPGNYFGFLNTQINEILSGCTNVASMSMSDIGKFAGMADFLDEIPEINGFDQQALIWNTGFGAIAMDLRSIISADPSQQSGMVHIAQKDIDEISNHLSMLPWYTASSS